MKRHCLHLIAAALAAAASLHAQETDYTKDLSVWFDTPNGLEGAGSWRTPAADRAWENASLPIGNGSLGGNVMGSVAAERVTLNEKSLWRGGPNTAGGAGYYWNVNKESARLLPEIRQAFADGDREKAARLTRQNFNGLADYEESRETPFRFGSYTTLGEVYVETGLSEVGMTGYRRVLSLDSALAVVSFRKDGVRYERKFFASYPDSVMAMRFAADAPGRQNLAFSYGPNPAATGEVRPDGPDGLLYVGRLDDNGMKFALRVRALHKGGTLGVEEGKIVVRDADEVTFLLAADTDYRMNFHPDFGDPLAYVGPDPEQTTLEMMRAATARPWAELYERHRADYSALFHRVRLDLNPSAPAGADGLPTGRRLARYRRGEPDFRLEAAYFQYGRYLLIASSRPGNLPANLQGIWANGVDGPWHVDYHNNINLQMNYWPALSTNLSECARPLTDFIRTLEEPGARTARAYFGARGWTASVSGNIFGFTSPLSDEDMSWNFSPMAGPWLATHVWDYYDYTRDRAFLRETGYPLLRGAARFAADYLWRKPDGTYTAAPSTSPEHGPVDEGATFVHAVAREVLLDAVEAARTLGTDARERREWQHVLDSLAPYRTGRYGQLMEWSADIDDPADRHRHVNHLFGLHPGRTLSPVATPLLADAARVVLDHRGDGATGWSMGWKLNQWARLHDGNRAYKLFGNLLKDGTMDNLWDTHPPFQIDGNFGGTAGVAEMLLQSHAGFIHLLPALPDAWADGSVDGLCARGNFEVGISWTGGRLAEAVVRARSGGRCDLRYGEATLALDLRKGETCRVGLREDGGLRRL